MAKELPYFKFEPNQWENGNIQMLSREDKGLFIDLCSMYWSRLGDVPFKLAVQKLCGGNASAFDSLIKEEIFLVENGLICIDYLNEQLLEFDNISDQNSKNAKARWEKHRKQKEKSERNASASNSQCETDAIREEKSKEEEIREDKKNAFSFRKNLYDIGINKNLVEDFLKNRKLKRLSNTETACKNLIIEFNKNEIPINELMETVVSNGWGSFKNSWLETNKTKNNGQQTTNKLRELSKAIRESERI
jgi:hypothetical protein